MVQPAVCVLVVRDGDTVKHYRIRQLDDGGFFIARRATFTTIANLVEHYSHDSDGLCMNLRKACSQVTHSDTSSSSHTCSICCCYTRRSRCQRQKDWSLPQASQQHISALPPFTVNNAPLCTVQQFTYLGSILSPDCDITNEVNQRITLASAAFDRLSHRVFYNHNLTISTKVAVYNACVCLFFSLAVKPGRCTVDTSKLLKPITLSHCRKFSVFTGGTRSLTPRCDAGPTLTAWNI